MTKETKETLALGEFQLGEPAFIDLRRLLRERLLIQASSGGGKSWLIRRLVEQAHGKVPIVLIDREGEFASLREKYDFVLAGKRGDTPVTVATAALLARTVLEVSANIICDLSELPLEDQQDWVGNFLNAFVGAPEEMWKDFLVILDEAHLFAPEDGKVTCKKAVANLTSLGRKRGFGAVLATQRLGKLDKDIAAELQNVLIGKTVLDIDRDRAARALDVSRIEKLNFFKSIRRLSPGIFYGYGNAIVDDAPRTLKVGPVATTHREPGARVAAVPPPPTDAIVHLLPRFKGLGAQAKREEQHRLEDAVEVAQMKAALEERCRTAEARVAELEQASSRIAELEAENALLLKQCDQAERRITEAVKVLEAPTTTQEDHLNGAPLVGFLPSPPRKLLKIAVAASKKDGEKPVRGLARGELEIIRVIVAHYPNPCSLEYLAVATGFALAGGFRNYITNLKNQGYIEKATSIAGYAATPKAMASTSDRSPPPKPDEIVKHWVEKKLTGKEKNILIGFFKLNGESMRLEKMADMVGMQLAGGFRNYITNLKNWHLIVKGLGGYKLADFLVRR